MSSKHRASQKATNNRWCQLTSTYCSKESLDGESDELSRRKTNGRLQSRKIQFFLVSIGSWLEREVKSDTQSTLSISRVSGRYHTNLLIYPQKQVVFLPGGIKNCHLLGAVGHSALQWGCLPQALAIWEVEGARGQFMGAVGTTRWEIITTSASYTLFQSTNACF